MQLKDSGLGESQLAGGDHSSRLFVSMAELQLFTKMLRYVIKWGIFWRTKQSGPIPRDERGKLLSLLFEGNVSQPIHHSKLWHFDHHGMKEVKNLVTIILQLKSPIWQPVFCGHTCQAVLTQTGVSSAKLKVRLTFACNIIFYFYFFKIHLFHFGIQVLGLEMLHAPPKIQ